MSLFKTFFELKFRVCASVKVKNTPELLPLMHILNIMSIKAAGLYAMHSYYSTGGKEHLATLPHFYVYPEKIYPCLWLSLSGTWWRY